ncbi:MAG TPA: tetratricopeptide repeat protein [Acidobacteriaceae bacterium]
MARRRLILRDALALFTLFVITAVIFTLTLMLYRSFENHREELGQRWKARGELALREGRPKDAIEPLRSALAYVPDRSTEIDLATAYAESGKTTEAEAYFNTLWESAPGDGTINLQLARLAARQGNEALAVSHYEAALDGTWQGNGYDVRRQVRLELAGYLLSRGRIDRARTQLMVAAGNAPDDPAIKIQIAGLMEQAKDLQDALGIYRSVAARRPTPIEALEGAGRDAFGLGMYRMASQYLGRAVAHPQFAKTDVAARTVVRGMLGTANRVLLLYPAFDLAARARAQRILALRDLARKRLTACAAGTTANAAPLMSLGARWAMVSTHLTAAQLEQEPDLEQSLVQLIYDTETTTAQTCGAPMGDDALLLRMAQNPNAVEQQ